MVILILPDLKLLRLLIKSVAQITKVRKYQLHEMGFIGAVVSCPVSL